ncbi:dihydrolipoyl dehydrogenase family protein [Thermodesulfobacteriota bacterium]
MGFNYDVAVIGTGTSAYTAAYACRGARKKVAVMDRLPYGGTCSLRGCQPKKYLVAAADAVAHVSNMQGIGLDGAPEINWSTLMSSKNEFTDYVPDETENGFLEEDIDTFYGHARFKGMNILAVGAQEISASHIIIATGAEPRHLDIPGEDLLTFSDEFMNLSSLPKEIIFIGGGFISFEFAHVANQAGAKVTILQRGNRVLKSFDPDLVQKLVESSEESGVMVKKEVCVDKIEEKEGRLLLHCLENPGEVFDADMVVHGAGRVPTIDDLDLEQGEVDYSEKGITVNDYLQSTTNPSVYAIGDVAATPYRLATTGDMEGEIAAKNILGDNKFQAEYSVVPTVVFTSPPMASVGLSEAEATETGKKIKISFGDMTGWNSSKRIGQKHAAYKVIIDEDSDLILGAHLLGHNAEEAINIFSLAIRHKLTTTDLKKTLWAYPTYISDIKYMIG